MPFYYFAFRYAFTYVGEEVGLFGVGRGSVGEEAAWCAMEVVP